MDVIAYSIHTEPVFILPKCKEEQCYAILDDIDPQDQLIVVGGDFNSFTEAYAAKLEERYRQAGFVRASKGCGPTFVRFGRKMFTDQIFTKGFIVEGAGKVENAKASDHLAIWTSLKPK